jgi:hypothetical protein
VLFDTKRNAEMAIGRTATTANAPEGPEAIRQENYSFPSPLYYASILALALVFVRVSIRGDYIDEVGGFCGTPLQAAAYVGHDELVDYFIVEGAEINYTSGHYGTALQAAAYRGHPTVLKFLLNLGADINAISGYYGDALQAAAAGGHAELVETLTQYGANPTSQGGKYGTALIAASHGNHRVIVRMLLENGAVINALDPREQITALYALASSGHTEVMQLLLIRGAIIDAAVDGSNSVLEACFLGEGLGRGLRVGRGLKKEMKSYIK